MFLICPTVDSFKTACFIFQDGILLIDMKVCFICDSCLILDFWSGLSVIGVSFISKWPGISAIPVCYSIICSVLFCKTENIILRSILFLFMPLVLFLVCSIGNCCHFYIKMTWFICASCFLFGCLVTFIFQNRLLFDMGASFISKWFVLFFILVSYLLVLSILF